MKKLSRICICSFVFCFHPAVLEAVVVYDFQIFTTNGNYYNDPGWNLYVEVVEVSATHVSFTFHNNERALSILLSQEFILTMIRLMGCFRALPP